MNLFGQTLVLYVLTGASVAVAVYLAEASGRRRGRWFRVATAVLFWPLYLPLLLGRAPTTPTRGRAAAAATDDALSAAIRQVDAELDAALGSLDGWAEEVLTREKDRFRDLRAAWLGQAERIRQMDRLLVLPEFAGEGIPD